MRTSTLTVKKLDNIGYEIELRDVYFMYPHGEEQVLHLVDRKFKIGDKMIIVGENGSGSQDKLVTEKNSKYYDLWNA